CVPDAAGQRPTRPVTGPVACHLRAAADRRDRGAAVRHRWRRQAAGGSSLGCRPGWAGWVVSDQLSTVSEELLSVEHLSRHFGGYAAVSELSFHVKQGEVLGLVGPNGAGKTTTFNVVTGFLKPSAGRVRFLGEDVTGLPPHALARRGLVRTFQHTRVFSDLTVRENVRVASHLQGRGGPLRVLFGSPRSETEELRAHVDEVLETVGLMARQHARAGSLAYGEQRVLEVALALAAKPRLLM